ncbi:MAG: hypothetical protein OER95_03970 [Acidimicrobiia bacterium]|nr:hypothetical protein [Acidimicrobiia bacterium]
MHPIEQLRYVARAGAADGRVLVEEAAGALRVFANDPAGLLTACKRLLTRQPAVGPLWWLCTRLVLSADTRSERRHVIDELRSDRTDRRLATALADGATVGLCGWPDAVVEGLARRGDCSALVVDVEGLGGSVVRRLERSSVEAEYVDGARMAGLVSEVDVVILEAGACGPSAALVDIGGLALAATARLIGRPVWLAVPTGTLLPEPYWQEIVERAFDPDLPAFLAPYEVVGLGLVDRVLRSDCELPGGQLGSATADCPVAPELLVSAR